ncbi:MAG: DUF503 domain-containing protein [Actinomycetota bacterium]|nr:DUF503 domain-containing protein [Actinomycetota bacterium]
MFVGVARFELFIPESSSLKTKRAILRSVIDGARHKFNASVSEVEYQDLWQRAALGITCSAGSAAHCRAVLSEIEGFVARTGAGAAELTGSVHQVLSFEDLLP